MRQIIIPALALGLSACSPQKPEQTKITAFEHTIAELPQTTELTKVLQKRASALNVTASTVTIQLNQTAPITIHHGEDTGQNSLFQAASLSKAVSALGILTLAKHKNIGLDDDIRGLTPSLDFKTIPGGEQPLTLRALLSHTAGASQMGFPGYPPKWRDAGALPTSIDVVTDPPHRFVNSVKLNGKRGQYKYSGGGYQIAQVFAEDVSGQTFATLMKDLIFEPLNMHHSTFAQPIDPEAIFPLKIAPARSKSRPLEGVFKGFESDWYDYPEQAAAGLWTTSEDYARFADAILRAWEGQDSPVSREIARTMLTPIDADYGIGLMLVRSEDQTTGFWHSGVNTGYRALFRVHMEPRFIVVSLANAPGGSVLNEELVTAVSRSHRLASSPTSPDAP